MFGGTDRKACQHKNIQASTKKKSYSWRRGRHSLKQLRDEDKFRKEQEIQEIIRREEEGREIRSYYFDGAGFNTRSGIPYAWIKKGEALEIICKRSKSINVLGLISRNNDSFFKTFDTNISSAEVIKFLDEFADQCEAAYLKTNIPNIITLDNASVNRAKAVIERLGIWASKGIFLNFLPPYSPELNLIEIAWRKIKYEWLPISCYQSRKLLKDTLLEMLEMFGKKYRITFV